MDSTITYGCYVRDKADFPLAQETIETLHQFYPGHGWNVFIGGGVMQIKSYEFSKVYGMVIKLVDINQDAMIRKKKVIMNAGEFLERAHVRRGAWEEPAKSVEGIPQRQFGR